MAVSTLSLTLPPLATIWLLMREGMTQPAIGEATPHGATYDHGVNFTLFSCGARRAVRFLIPEGNERSLDLRDVAAMSGMVIWRAPGRGLR